MSKYDWSLARKMAEMGCTAPQIAAAIGCLHTAQVHTWAKAKGITLVHAPSGAPKITQPDARAQRMLDMYRQGLTLAKIGEQFGVTRERVRQIAKKFGAVRAGIAMRSARNDQKKDAKQRSFAARVFAKWGVEVDLWRELRANGTVRAYEQQRQSSSIRGIGWHLTFADWYAVWQASGKLHLRGRGKGKYCMSRIKDGGAYELGNVHIQLCTVNSQEAVEKWAGKKKPIKGIYCMYPGREMAWLAKYGNTRLGYFSSAEAAADARHKYMVEHGIATVAQSAEHLTRNETRVGSIPTRGPTQQAEAA